MSKIFKLANLAALVLFVGTVFSGSSAVAQQWRSQWPNIWFNGGPNSINISSLYGWYGFLVAGPSSTPGAGGKYLTGAIFFNGNGGLTGYNVNGGSNGQVGNTSVTGTYVANGNGTINITMNLKGQSAPQTYVVSVRQTSFGAVGIETDGSAIATIDLQSQFVFWPFSFNNGSLSGAYASSCTGNPGNYAQLNYVTFDGKGNLSGLDPYDDNNLMGVNPFSGTYTVNSDGTFSAVTAPSVSITGVISNFGTEIQYTYNVTGFGEIISCIGRK